MKLRHLAPELRRFAVEIDGLKPDAQNVRLHGKQNIDEIRASLKEFGQQSLIIVGPGGVVKVGNGVLTAARSLGWKYVAAVKTNLTGGRLRAYGIADNKTGESSEWDENELNKQLAELADEGESVLAATGFTTGPDAEEKSNETNMIEDFQINPPTPVAWILLAIPIRQFAEARSHLAVLEKIADLKVEVARDE